MTSKDEDLEDEVGEVEFVLETSEDAKSVKLIMNSTRPMDYRDLILALEFYLSEITRAERQKRQQGLRDH